MPPLKEKTNQLWESLLQTSPNRSLSLRNENHYSKWTRVLNFFLEKSKTKPGIIVYFYNPSTLEAEAGGLLHLSSVWDRLWDPIYNNKDRKIGKVGLRSKVRMPAAKADNLHLIPGTRMLERTYSMCSDLCTCVVAHKHICTQMQTNKQIEELDRNKSD